MPVKTKWAGYVRATIRSFDVRTTSQGEAQNSSIKSDNGIKANMTICRTAEAINMKADNSYKVKKWKAQGIYQQRQPGQYQRQVEN